MTVEKIIKELMKIPNQQLHVYFKTGNRLPMMSGIEIPIDNVAKESVVTLDGQQQAVMFIGKE